MSEDAFDRLFGEIGTAASSVVLTAVSEAFPKLGDEDAGRFAGGILLTAAVVTAASAGVGRDEIAERFAAVISSALEDVFAEPPS